MRHRASRPLVDSWHRLPRATARRLGAAAAPGPARVLVALVVVLTLGVGGYVASVLGGPSTRPIESAVPPASRDADRAPLAKQLPSSDGRTPDERSSGPDGSTSEPAAPPTGQPQPPSPTSDATPSLRTTLGQVTGPPSAPTATPSTTSPHPSPTASPTLEDITAPITSLFAEFPEPDAARFWFSANEDGSFTCSLDGAAFTSCDSPMRYSDLDPGWHTFAVQATDAAGTIDLSPAETRWLATDGHSAAQ